MRETFIPQILAAVVAVGALAAGCNEPAGPGGEPSSRPAASAKAMVSAAPSAPATASAVATASAAPAAPDGAPRPAASSHPAGAEPLTGAENQELEGKCKPFAEAVAKAGADKKGEKHTPDIEDVVAHLPEVKGVDAARCGNLLLRFYHADYAAKNEKEALANLKSLADAMGKAWDHKPPQLCESAGPVPGSLSAVENKKYMSAPKDWEGAGWKCLTFALTDPQRYQYDVKTDAAKQTFRATARGNPFKGAAVSELFVEGHTDKGKLVTSEVMRQASK